jgi:hypothetical protein
MTATRCACCAGSGKVMGGGMITERRCDNCYGTGKPQTIPKIDYKKAKKTKSYQDAMRRLREKDVNLSSRKAAKILDDELKNIGQK